MGQWLSGNSGYRDNNNVVWIIKDNPNGVVVAQPFGEHTYGGSSISISASGSPDERVAKVGAAIDEHAAKFDPKTGEPVKGWVKWAVIGGLAAAVVLFGGSSKR